ncbi:MAG: DUF4062 domain-containing protein [Nitrosospira sp.]
MARLRVFVSSTCYDLDILRSELRPFISGLGYEPVMSDYSDVLYDPRSHTHDSCLKEVPACDMVILIIGSRFGGLAIPTAFAQLDFAALEQLSMKSDVLETKDRLSITQLEVLKAVEQSVPVYAFVDEKVMHDHHVYERNKDKTDIIEQIEFPSIQKRDTAKYIFEFINFLNHRVINNSVTPFSRLEEIRQHLLSQWSQMLQRLLLENRTRTQELRRYRDFSEQIEDLKAVVMASLVTPDLREIAKGAIQYRTLIRFVSGLQFVNHRDLLLSDLTWEQALAKARIVDIVNVPASEIEERSASSDVYLVLDDKTFYRCRFPRHFIDGMSYDWSRFQGLEDHSREAIVDALLEDRRPGVYMRSVLIYVPENVDEYLPQKAAPSAAESEAEDQS